MWISVPHLFLAWVPIPSSFVAGAGKNLRPKDVDQRHSSRIQVCRGAKHHPAILVLVFYIVSHGGKLHDFFLRHFFGRQNASNPALTHHHYSMAHS